MHARTHLSSFLLLCSEEMKKLLYALFAQFGRILDVVVMSKEKVRGQAWVVYADLTAATNALRAMQEFPFFDKPMVSGGWASLVTLLWCLSRRLRLLLVLGIQLCERGTLNPTD
jgi:hypothetical protein